MCAIVLKGFFRNRPGNGFRTCIAGFPRDFGWSVTWASGGCPWWNRGWEFQFLLSVFGIGVVFRAVDLTLCAKGEGFFWGTRCIWHLTTSCEQCRYIEFLLLRGFSPVFVYFHSFSLCRLVEGVAKQEPAGRERSGHPRWFNQRVDANWGFRAQFSVQYFEKCLVEATENALLMSCNTPPNLTARDDSSLQRANRDFLTIVGQVMRVFTCWKTEQCASIKPLLVSWFSVFR